MESMEIIAVMGIMAVSIAVGITVFAFMVLKRPEYMKAVIIHGDEVTVNSGIPATYKINEIKMIQFKMPHRSAWTRWGYMRVIKFNGHKSRLFRVSYTGGCEAIEELKKHGIYCGVETYGREI